jgi:hypothetical protein
MLGNWIAEGRSRALPTDRPEELSETLLNVRRDKWGKLARVL